MMRLCYASEPSILAQGSPAHSSPKTSASPSGRDFTEPKCQTQASSSDEEDSPHDISEYLKKMHVGDNVVRFWGKSSGVMLVKSAVSFKSSISETGEEHWASSILAMRRPQFWHQLPVCWFNNTSVRQPSYTVSVGRCAGPGRPVPQVHFPSR